MLRKIILFISSYIPLYILMVLKNLLERCTDKGRFLNLEYKLKNIVLFDEINDWAIVIISVLTVFSLIYLKKKIGNTYGEVYYKIHKVSDETSNNYFNYISVYLLSCLGLSLNNIVDVFIFVFLMILVGYIYIANDMIYLNPTLNMMKYNVYSVELVAEATDTVVSSIVIAKRGIKIKEGTRVKGTKKYELIVLDSEMHEKIVSQRI